MSEPKPNIIEYRRYRDREGGNHAVALVSFKTTKWPYLKNKEWRYRHVSTDSFDATFVEYPFDSFKDMDEFILYHGLERMNLIEMKIEEMDGIMTDGTYDEYTFDDMTGAYNKKEKDFLSREEMKI